MALAIATGALLTSCGGGSKDTATIKGTVTYTRRSLTTDSDGIPTGLSTSYGSAQVARGVRVRLYEADEQTGESGTEVVYKIYSTAFTDDDGVYSVTAPKDEACFVQLESVAGTSSTNTIRLVADTSVDLSDIDAGTAIADRPLYALRKTPAGTSSTTDPLLTTTVSGGSTVNFAIDSSTYWWKVPASADLATEASLESSPTGSRLPAIMDSIYAFYDIYGDPTPGGSLDLFYRPTLSDDDRGTFVDCSDTNQLYGSIRANQNDDAWDASIIYMLCARNALYSHTTVTPFPFQAKQLPLDSTGVARSVGLNPVHAMLNGFPYGMAATLLQSPYLADTTDDGSLVEYHDIRDISSMDKDAFSSPSLAALSWAIFLKANKITTDSVSTWSNLDEESLYRFFNLRIPTDSDSHAADTASIYKQLTRLQESKSSSDSVDLESIFTDTVLTNLVSDYGLTWPRPSSGSEASFLLDWGTDPSGDYTLTMGQESAVADADGTFPNFSKDEIKHARFLMSMDALYELSVAISPALPDGASLQLKIQDASAQLLTGTVTGSGGTITDSLMLDGNADTPTYIPVYLRLLTGSLTDKLDNRTVTVTFTKRAS
nr:hypothetical protein [uncultured Holophaga sp.]